MRRNAIIVILAVMSLTCAAWVYSSPPPMTGGGSGVTLDNNASHCYRGDGTWALCSSAEADTLATVSARGHTTTTGVHVSGVSSSIDNATITNSTITGYIVTGGNAGTASALAADPANCSAGQIALGITAAGVAECTATPSGLTSVGATTFTGALTGNATGLSGTPNITVGTVSAGAAGFTVDADGDTVAKSISITRTNAPQTVKLYEATSDGNDSLTITVPTNGTGLSGDKTLTLNQSLALTGTMTDTKACTYASSGTQISCNTTLTSGTVTGTGTQYYLPYWSSTSALGALAAAGTDGQVPKGVTGGAPVFGNPVPEADCSGNATITVAQALNGVVCNNYGQAAAPIGITLPAAAAGMSVMAVMGTAQAGGSNYWHLQTPGLAAVMYLDGSVTGKYWVGIAAPVKGNYFSCFSFRTGASEWSWICSTGAGTTVTN
jgi:hypothetical protein